jgi:phage tail sheath protein FI
VNRGLLAVDSIRYAYNQTKRDALNDAQINMLRKMPSGAYAIWNQSTLQSSPSALQSINVRRLFSYIEKSVAASVVTDLFDPNDNSLRTSIRLKIQDFLQPIKAAGGLAAYTITCDESNNTSDLIANGDLVVDVIIDAESVLPVKRILFRATINRTGVRVTS